MKYFQHFNMPRLVVVMVALLLSSCSSLPVEGMPYSSLPPYATPSGTPTQTPIPQIFDNEGGACITYVTDTAFEIVAGPNIPDKCWPSSCTLVLEENHEFTVDRASRIIHLDWYVVARGNYVVGRDGMVACTADCGGLPTWEAEFDSLEDGEYVVKIGDHNVGTIAVPYEHGSRQICFDSTQISAPTPTTRPMSQSPLSTPAAGSK